MFLIIMNYNSWFELWFFEFKMGFKFKIVNLIILFK